MYRVAKICTCLMEIVLGVALLKWGYDANNGRAPTKQLQRQANLLRLLCGLYVIWVDSSLTFAVFYACASMGMLLFDIESLRKVTIHRLPSALPTMERAKTV